MKTTVYQIKVPEYTVKKKPDYLKIGKKVDSFITQKFPDGKYIVRAIGKQDHPKLTLNKLVSIISRLGTDKYNPKKKAVAHKLFSGYEYDIHANLITIKNSKIVTSKSDKFPTFFGELIYNFYENAPGDRGYSVRLDLLIIYDPKKLTKPRKFNPKIKEAQKWNEHLYKFKDPKNKKDALLGIIKILK